MTHVCMCVCVVSPCPYSAFGGINAFSVRISIAVFVCFATDPSCTYVASEVM